MKKLACIFLTLVFLMSCGDKERENEHLPPPLPDMEMNEDQMNTMGGERDSVLEERKKRMMDRLTEKLGLTEDQIREVKKIEDEYAVQLYELKEKMEKVRKEYHQLSKEKREKIKKILTAEQIEKLESLRKDFKERKHRSFKDKKHP